MPLAADLASTLIHRWNSMSQLLLLAAVLQRFSWEPVLQAELKVELGGSCAKLAGLLLVLAACLGR